MKTVTFEKGASVKKYIIKIQEEIYSDNEVALWNVWFLFNSISIENHNDFCDKDEALANCKEFMEEFFPECKHAETVIRDLNGDLISREKHD